MTSLAGRHVLVVGASSGIGEAIAIASARAGARVAIAARRESRLREVEAAIGDDVTVITADISNSSDAARVVDEAVASGGGIDLLVHSAAIASLVQMNHTSSATWESTFATNVIGPSLVTAAALPHLSAGAVVAFLSSESVGAPFHGLGAYSASKAALDETVLVWRIEHPEVRFLRVVVGRTQGGEMNRDHESELVEQLLPQWVAAGRMPGAPMDAANLGQYLVTVLAANLDHPSVGTETIVCRPTGPTPPELAAMVRVEVDRAQRTAASTRK
jgi:NAD(P)-dependent dehydrogenase (short-subunit alcohol dehydrogenase family)